MPDSTPYLANPERMAAEVAAAVLAPPPPVDYLAWATAHIRFESGATYPGPYNPDLFPYFSRVLEVLAPDHPARVVVLKKSAQLGGTVLAQIFLGGSMDLDPCQFLYVHPTIDNAIRWVKTKWRVMIRQTTALARMFPATTSRDGTNSMLFQERSDGRGQLLISGANSAASLSMITMTRQIQDDLSKWQTNDAGDPEGQADSRSMAVEWAKIFKIGTPTIKPECRITKAFDRSTQEHYHLPCPHCGDFHPLEWQNFLASVDEDKPDQAHFVCGACGGLIEEHHLREMNRHGRWVAENPGAETIGFYIWSAYSPLMSWKRLRDDWLSAKGDPETERVYLNDKLGLVYEPAGESPPWEDLKKRTETDGHTRGQIPVGGLLLALSADCQSDRVEWHLRAYGRQLRAFTVDYGVIVGHISEAETMTRLDALLARSWPDSFGNRRAVGMAAIDGNAWTEDVFAWVRRHPASKVMMVRGVASDQAPFLARVRRERDHKGDLKKYVKRFYNVGVSPMKMSLYKNLAKSDPLQRGYNGFPKGMEDDFFQQLCAERRTPIKKRDGSVEYRWTKEPTQRNEVLDTALYADAAAIRMGWRDMGENQWDLLTSQLEQQAPDRQLDLEDALTAPAAAETAAPATSPEPTAETARPWLQGGKGRDGKWLSPKRN